MENTDAHEYLSYSEDGSQYPQTYDDKTSPPEEDDSVKLFIGQVCKP